MTIKFRQCFLIVAAVFTLTFAVSAQKEYSIAEIQGDKPRSALENQQVTTRGIVTARSKNGIFIQTPDDKIDANPATSEAVFIFLGQNGSFNGAIGDMVEVAGTVEEYLDRKEKFAFTRTDIGKTTIKIISSKNPLPKPIVLTTSDLVPNKLDLMERYEGMRVKVDTLTVVAPTGGKVADERNDYKMTSDGVFYGVLPGVKRPMREPGVDYFTHQGNKLSATVPFFDTNPEMLRVDSIFQNGAKPVEVTAGAIVKDLTGIIEYASARYTLAIDASHPPTVEGNKTFTKVSPAGEREVTVATFNVENFFDDEKNSSNVKDEAVPPKDVFQKKLAKTSLAIRNVLSMPDLIGVGEVEHLAALKKLAAKINADAVADGKPDPKYEAYLEDGNDVRGIDSGFLVKSTKLKVLETKQLAKDVELDFASRAELHLFDRPPFLIRVQAIDAKSATPLAITAIVNHFKSYGGIDSEKDGPRTRQKRKQEAEWLANFVVERQKTNPDELLLICGDFNAFLVNDGYNDLIGTLKGKPDQTVTNPSKTYATGLYDLADFIADPTSRYSYVFEGSAQVLDHILVNKKLLKMNEGRLKFGYARLNADFPVSYSTDITRPERVSDHDAPVVFLSLDEPVKAAASPAPSPEGKSKENSDKMNSGILYGPNFSYTLSAPRGWILDNESGVSQGLSAVFYPKGSSWSKGQTVAYTRVVKKNDQQTVSDIINADINGFRAESSALKIEDAKAIDLGKGKTAIIKYFSGDSHGNYEALAYVDEAKSVVLIVLTARTKQDFDSSLGAFQGLVGSYFFLTDQVYIQK
jgi:predicted extracellular nuclease